MRNIKCIKSNDGEVGKHVTVQTNSRVLKLFRIYSNLLQICFKSNHGEVGKRVTVKKRILVFWNFSAFIPICSKWQISVYFTGVAPLETAPKLERRKKNSPSYSKRRIRKFHVAACRDVTEMYQKACKIYCLTWNLLLFDVFLVAIGRCRYQSHPVLSMCVNCWESECECF